jgi:hypothetical protein
MPELKNPGWEAFAQACARGQSQKEAYVAAGYSARSNDGPVALFKREVVRQRIAELEGQNACLREANLEETILALLALAKADATTAAGAREARVARLEAHRLAGLLAARREAETWTPVRELTEAEWDAKYGPDAPGSRC